MTVSQALVNQYYLGIFRASPSPAQSNTYQSMADSQAVLDAMLLAANSTTDPIVRLYQAFDRVPDSAGLTYWVNQYSSGAMTLNQIANSFAASSEFTSTYSPSLSNADYVNALYQNVLLRVGDAAGVNYWTGQLNSNALTRGQVMLNFTQSSEFKSKSDLFVNAYLTNCADNNPASYAGTLFSKSTPFPDQVYVQFHNGDPQVAMSTVTDTAADSLIIGAYAAGTTGSVDEAQLDWVIANNEEFITVVDATSTNADPIEEMQIVKLDAADLTTMVLNGTNEKVIGLGSFISGRPNFTTSTYNDTSLTLVDASANQGYTFLDFSGATNGISIWAAKNVTNHGAGPFDNIISGGAGADIIVGSASDDWLSGQAGRDIIKGGGAIGYDIINGGTGADTMTGGLGSSRYVQRSTFSELETAFSSPGANALNAGQSVTFGNGLDIVTDFEIARDIISVGYVASGIVSLLGQGSAALTDAGQVYYLSGTWNAGSQIFTVAANGSGADTLVALSGAAGTTFSTNGSAIVLLGVNSADLTATNFAA